MSTRYWKAQIGLYHVEVQDYRYTSRAPVAVRVTGTVDGECRNSFGEPCRFVQFDDAMTMAEGIEKGKAIIAGAHGRTP